MSRSVVSSMWRNAHVFAAQVSIAGLALCAMPLLAQSSNAHDEHAMHAPVAKKPQAKAAKAKADAKAVDHGDHVMGNEVVKKADADHSEAKGEHAGMDHSKHAGMDHAGMSDADMAGMDHGKHQGMNHAATTDSDKAAMDHSKHAGMDHSAMSDADMAGMDNSKHEGMDHSAMSDADMAKMDHNNHEGMDHAAMSDADMAGMDNSKHEGMDHAAMTDGDMAGMDHGSMNMQGGSAPPDARDPDFSDGVEAAHMHGLHKHGVVSLGSVMVDQLEVFSGDGSSGQAIDMQAWYGGDLNKLWFKGESERSDGQQGATRIEALWNHAYAAYWGAQVGLRHDVGEGPSRDWVAFGVQGLAPYWFEVEATAYVGESGRTALRLEAEYELLLTQRLILQPDVELNVYGKDDPARGIGSGLSDLDVGLRLRYEFTRKFAPYVGVVWSRKFGGTADFARAEGGGAEDTQVVAGLRIWF